MKKRIAIGLIMCLVLQTVVFAASDYADIQNHWAKPYIEALADRNAVSGTDDGLFHPDGQVTFGQFVAMIAESAREETEPGNGDPDSGYLELALEKGIIDAGDLESAGSVITRLTAVRLCHMTLLNILGEGDEENASAAARDLIDFNSCHTCREHLSQLYAKGIVTGRPGNVFDGDAGLTRAEACALVMRMIDPSLRAAPPLPSENDVLISPESVLYIMETDDKAVLVDVRSQEEYDAAHIPGSVCIPVSQLIESGAVQLPDKSAVIIVYCQVGYRSQQAYEYLIELGYTYVYHMGGIVDWPYDLEIS